MNRLGIANRTAKAGIRPLCDALRERIRLHHLAAGKTKAEALELAWAESWEEVRPVLEHLEAKAAEARKALDQALDDAKAQAAKARANEPPAPQLPGIPANLDDALDPDYAEADPSRQVRDGLLWAVMQFARVVADTPTGPVAHLERATSPPPNALAVFTLTTYALLPPAQRKELLTKATAFAYKGQDDTPTPERAEEGGGFLDEV